MDPSFVSIDSHKRNSRNVSSFDTCISLIRNVNRVALLGTSVFLVGCASSGPKSADPLPPGAKGEMAAVKMAGPVQLRLKAQAKSSETVDYYHVSSSRAFEGKELRHEKTEQLAFTAQADTTKAENDRFTQSISVTKKDGTIGLHDFAMPELGEKLEVVTDSRGKILKAGDWPTNSIFYVSPVSLPENPVEVGDTWTMQSSWLSLQDMVPYELDMVSILKGFVKCGEDTCADIEVSGNVAMQGSLQKTLVFRSEWRGRLLFAIGEGTVAWSRVDSDELFAYDKVYRTVGSCLEAALRGPGKAAVTVGDAKPTCAGFAPPAAVR